MKRSSRRDTSSDGDVRIFASATKVCPDCGDRFRRWSFLCGSRAPDGRSCGNAYCRCCANERVKRKMASPANVTRVCDGCGTTYSPRYGTDMNAKYAGGRRRRYCSPECMAFATAISKDGLCVAPCEPRCRRSCFGSAHGLCQGHDKRRERGAAIDTPLNERLSAINKASRARMLAV